MKKYTLIILLITICSLISCSRSSTLVTGTWRAPEQTMHLYKNVLVTAFVNNIQTKSMLEDEMQSELTKKGLTVSRSIDVFPPTFTNNEDDRSRIFNEIKKDGFDGILTISIIDKETKSRYVPGNYGYRYAPYPAFNYYGNFWGYFSYWYPIMYSPGYYVQDKIYFIETNLYDAKSGKLQWSAQSETYSPGSIQAFSDDFTEAIASELRDDNFI